MEIGTEVKIRRVKLIASAMSGLGEIGTGTEVAGNTRDESRSATPTVGWVTHGVRLT